MNNIVSIDTEYNKFKDILSLGIYSEKEKYEKFFKEKVDSRTIKIHGIPACFLTNKEKYSPEIGAKLISRYKFVIGFDIYHDLESLKIKNISKLYSDHKIIDLKNIFEALGYKISLSKLYNLTKIKIKHSSFSDSKVTYDSFMYLYSFLKNNISFSDFCILSAKLTESFFNGDSWNKDEIIYNFSCIFKDKEIFNKELFSTKEDNLKKKKDIILLNNFVCVFENNYLVYRFPKKYINKEINFLNNQKILKNQINTNSIKFDLSLLDKRFKTTDN